MEPVVALILLVVGLMLEHGRRREAVRVRPDRRR
jgi:hypothetical protein